jgi:diaminohydroxyphosphoribosylaminopyrimidine deaminase / 5-amino-6-(5-phosphoribosylamino)uracil reductase
MNLMQEALKLAERGRYSVAPNPMVGCIIEKEGKIIGRGYHQKAGLAHAEVMALREAGDLACGANVYVTLEPCSHFGRTPPCVDALVKAKVSSVHIPFADPNPLVAGQGVTKLKAAGIQVFLGEEADLARQQNEMFLFYITHNRPWVVAKWAMTLDGRIAADTGDARWISSEAARRKVHYTRCELGAVLIGSDTAINDDPLLTPYLLEDATDQRSNPFRIILDSRGRLPDSAALLKHQDPEKTLVITTARSSLGWRKQIRNTGADVLILPENQQAQVDIWALLTVLGERKISGLLVEGGQKIFASFFLANAVNKIHAYIAPKLIGGKNNFSPVGNLQLSKMVEAKKIKIIKSEMVGEDIFVEANLNQDEPNYNQVEDDNLCLLE